MRQPIWAVNSSLIFFFIFSQLVFLFMPMPMPRRVSLEPEQIKGSEKKSAVIVNIEKIYGDNDLFNTYANVVAKEVKSIEFQIPEIPQAPAPIPVSIPVEAPKIVIQPLAAILKGVIYVHDRPEQSIAVVQFSDSKEEINYHVGQLINDAQILKIYPNRMIVVRSNGQQETLYLSEDEAGRDMKFDAHKDISKMSIFVKGNVYQVPLELFVSHVKNLGQFIDLLDLTTVYKKGKSVGCRVGKAAKDSLGAKLGFEKDDVIEQVDSLPITDVASRILAFDHLCEKKVGDSFVVKVDRSAKPVMLKYTLTISPEKKITAAQVSAKANTSTPVTAGPGAAGVPVAPMGATQFGVAAKQVPKVIAQPAVDEQTLFDIEEQRKKILEQKVQMAPTAHKLEMEERRKMFEARRREALANRYSQDTSGIRSFANAVQVGQNRFSDLNNGAIWGQKG